MATWNDNAIIGLVFIPLYSLLFCFNVFNCKLHGIRKEGGYICLLAVSVCMELPELIALLNDSENYWRYLDDAILDWDFRLFSSCILGCKSSTTRVLPTLHCNTCLHPKMVQHLSIVRSNCQAPYLGFGCAEARSLSQTRALHQRHPSRSFHLYHYWRSME